MKKYLFIIILFLSLPAAKLPALESINLWRHPEMAEQHSIFIDLGIPIMIADWQFDVLPLLEMRLEYMLPMPLPISLGIFFHTPYPNFKSFGLRLGYHFDINDPLLDIYFVYSFNFGFLMKDILAEYNDKPPPIHFYDFRIGVRRAFGGFFGISIETGHKLQSIVVLFTIILNKSGGF
jgi:hypothetical protein